MRFFIVIFFFILSFSLSAQQSVARQWNEVILESIRLDFARPTVHARNLFHSSVVMYDSWALFNKEEAKTYLVGNELNGFSCYLDTIPLQASVDTIEFIEETMSHAVYTLLRYRFRNSPNRAEAFQLYEDLMTDLGYVSNNTSQDYSMGSAAALGNYIGDCMIRYGQQDGANDENDYANLYYQPANPTLLPALSGNPDINDPNRWQPLTLDVFIDQSGNVIPRNTPEFLSPEWGNVYPFALSDPDLYTRNSDSYNIYADPGTPPLIDVDSLSGYYKWGFSMVPIWASHLDPLDQVVWDISPASIGNVDSLPDSYEEHPDFYNYLEGGDVNTGYTVNPITGLPYEPNLVKRGDYTRVLAEFWADGPDSETPPGHWYVILNRITDHPLLERKYAGKGEELSSLEWDIKSYFLLGAAMHDVAISVWSVKGWYDYLRPISAVRYMADNGQSSDENLPSYHEDGITLVNGYIELIESGDPLAGNSNENVGKIKLFTWKGPDYISDPDIDNAGVDWILAEDWWPYQRASFVTPPFAGYVSGHSTFSNAAADILTYLTGDNYFPGGIGEFDIPQDDFLVFEKGPSESFKLQWATYKDAASQSCLSRIWGGIHPPADDIPGRKMAVDIAKNAFDSANEYFTGNKVVSVATAPTELTCYPNPVRDELTILKPNGATYTHCTIYTAEGKLLDHRPLDGTRTELPMSGYPSGTYLLKVDDSTDPVVIEKM